MIEWLNSVVFYCKHEQEYVGRCIEASERRCVKMFNIAAVDGAFGADRPDTPIDDS